MADKFIEDELRAAGQGTCVMHFLIRNWSRIVGHLRDGEADSIERAVGKLGISASTTSLHQHETTPALTAESSPSIESPSSPVHPPSLDYHVLVDTRSATADDIDALQKCLAQDNSDDDLLNRDNQNLKEMKLEPDVVLQGLSLIDIHTKTALPTGGARSPSSLRSIGRSRPISLASFRTTTAPAAPPIMESRFSISPVPPASHGSDLSSSPMRPMSTIHASPRSARFSYHTPPPEQYGFSQHVASNATHDGDDKSAAKTIAALQDELRRARQDLHAAYAETALLVDANLQLKQENLRLRRSAIVMK